MAVSKKLRFEVFRRDNFACRYCGRTARDGAYLEPDHVVPSSRGGKDVATNLVTACDGCNSGKSDTPLQAPTIADVAQDIFRQACAERGVQGVEPDTAISDDVSDLIAGVLGSFYEHERVEMFEKARQLLTEIDEADPTEDQIEARAAEHGSHLMSLEVFRLSNIVDRLLRLHPPEAIDEVWERTSQKNLAEQEGAPAPQRFSTFVAAVANAFLQDCDEALLADLAPDEIAEWTAFANALFGEPSREVGDAYTTRNVARVLRIVQAGRYYPEMCRGSGEHIDMCPRRAEHRIWLDGCAHCDREADPDSGHTVCGVHLDRVRRGIFRPGYTGPRRTLRESEVIATGQRELA